MPRYRVEIEQVEFTVRRSNLETNAATPDEALVKLWAIIGQSSYGWEKKYHTIHSYPTIREVPDRKGGR